MGGEHSKGVVSCGVLCCKVSSDEMFEFVLQLSSYMQANATYFHQGSDMCEQLAPFLRKLDDDVSFFSLFSRPRPLTIFHSEALNFP